MAGMYGSFGDIKKVVIVGTVLIAASFLLGFGAGYKAGSGSVSSSNAGTLSPEQQRIRDAINNAGKSNNTGSNAVAGGTTATPSPTPASNESFEERLRRQREGANK